MPRTITRQTLKLFGSAGSSTFFAQWGSQTAGSPLKTKDIPTIQALSAWLNGIQSEVLPSNNAPFLEDFNALFWVFCYMLFYILQEGIAEWDSGTTYFIGSTVRRPGTSEQYGSLIDANLGNAPPVMASNANWRWLNPPPIPIPQSGLQNLRAQANTGTPLIKVDVTADAAVVGGVVLTAFSGTADITVSGANGLDTGAPTANTWYAQHLITNDNGSLSALLFSLSPTAPTLPAGFTKSRRIHWVRNNASGNLVSAHRQNDCVVLDDPNPSLQTFSSNFTGLISFGSFLPPSCLKASFAANGSVNQTSTASGVAAHASFSVRGNSTATYATVCGASAFNPTTGSIGSDFSGFDYEVNSSQQLDSEVSIATAESAGVTIIATGYYDPV